MISIEPIENKIIVNPNITYFMKYWITVLTEFKNEVSNSINLITPQVIIMETINEIELNDLKDNWIKTYNKIILDDIDYIDFENSKNIRYKFHSLIINLDVSQKNSLQLCSEIKKIHDTIFIDEIIKKLKSLLSLEKINPKQKKIIKKLASYLIVKFLEKGFSKEEILMVPQKIFSEKFEVRNGKFYTDIPLTIKNQYKEYSEKGKLSIFFDIAKKEFQELNLENRIDLLKNLLNKTPEIKFAIFKVNNFYITEIGESIKLGDLEIYSSDKKNILLKMLVKIILKLKTTYFLN